MIIGKKHFVLAALILALGAAVYLNWQFAPSDTLVADVVSENADDMAENQLGSEYVAAVNHASSSDASAEVNAQNDTVSAAKQTDGFENARNERKKSRDDALAMLQEIIDNAALDAGQKTEAVNTAAAIAEAIEKEAAIESLVKAKGYKDCVVIISETQVNVIVPPSDSGITAADAAIIRDIVIGQIEISPSCIKIIEAK